MKKTLLASLILFLSFLSNAQQTFSPPGAKWYYYFTVTTTPLFGFNRISYTGDSLIAGIQCKKLKQETYIFSPPATLMYAFTGAPPVLIYQNSDTVFKLSDNGNWYVWFNFAAQPGDEWVIDNLTIPTVCDPLPKLKVTGLSNSNINGQLLKSIAVDTVGLAPIGYHGNILERVGPIGANDFFPMGQNCDPNTIIDFYLYSFACYEDSAFGLYNVTGLPCGYWLNTGINEMTKGNLSISPNPASETFLIKMPQDFVNGELIITSITGEIIFSTHIDKRILELTFSLASGFYFVELKGMNQHYIQKLVVKNN